MKEKKSVKTTHAIAFVIGGIVVGGVAVEGLHAQSKPPVFVVNEIEVTDQAGFQAYAEKNRKVIEKHGGKYVVRGGKVIETLDGTAPTGRYTVYTFESQAKMNEWRSDPDIKDTLASRGKLGKFRSFVVEGPTS
jgi:uncharacterized protein (DUF1330 family)